MVRAVAAYKADQKKLKKDRCGYRKICLDLESHHFQETGNYIYTIDQEPESGSDDAGEGEESASASGSNGDDDNDDND